MSKPVRRPGSSVYYARRVVPKELQPLLGRREVWRSLRTKDYEEAKRLNRAAQTAFDDEFSAARAKVAVSQTANSEPFTGALSGAALKRFQDARLEYEQEFLEWDAADLLELESDPIRKRIAEAVQDALTRRERENADLARELNQAQALASGKTGLTPLALVVDRWAQSNGPAPKTIDRMRAVVGWFEDHCGRVAVEAITEDHVRSFRDALLRRTTPSNARVKLRNLSTLLRFASRDLRLVSSNPAAAISIVVKATPQAKRTIFELGDLQAVFGSPVYRDGSRPTGGADEAGYWLPLLALYTGARLEELGQLRPSDITEASFIRSDGTTQSSWVIRIAQDEAEGLYLKNVWSARRIPLHPDLIALGFLDYVSGAKPALNARGQMRLFPALKPDKYGTETANWSKWFNRYLREVCGVEDRRVVFHSFRHSFKHYARELGIPKDVHDAITGHKSRDVADDYGHMNYPLAPLVDAINRWRVPGLSLPTLLGSVQAGARVA